MFLLKILARGLLLGECLEIRFSKSTYIGRYTFIIRWVKPDNVSTSVLRIDFWGCEF